MAYAVSLKASAVKQVERLARPIAARILAKTANLATDPRPPGCVKLAGGGNLWRVRVGDYRIVYVIGDDNRRVEIRIVAHRREVYRDL